MSTWIKFCGTTSVDDALASVEAGANALGFIFAASKRQVTLEKAREIIRDLPGEVEKIGVFVDESAEEIRSCVEEARLTGIQLHDPKLLVGLENRLRLAQQQGLRIIKTLIVTDGVSLPRNTKEADVWLLDSGAGSGKTFDWQAVRAQLAERQGRFIIAGGLTPQNVSEAVGIFSPWGVDVVSGIEREPGRKDREKMKAFVAAVRKAEQP